MANKKRECDWLPVASSLGLGHLTLQSKINSGMFRRYIYAKKTPALAAILSDFFSVLTWGDPDSVTAPAIGRWNCDDTGISEIRRMPQKVGKCHFFGLSKDTFTLSNSIGCSFCPWRSQCLYSVNSRRV